MNIWELSEKAEYIADKHQRLLSQWHHYGNTLIQGITLSKAKLHHSVGCNADESLRFFLFDHFAIHISLAEGFNSHTIEYAIALRDGSDKVLIAKAVIDDDGRIDNLISNRDREKVLDHYLELIRPVYDSLYQAVHDNTPLSLALLQQSAVA
ncbi:MULTISPECIES: formate hydrogenlyase regulator HycA [Cedecea]|uniref:Formate hydrogenlyase regulatory protein HycA n=2 Tax=Cedecea davisae TaxID=158484 RepID=S3IIY3_9ENTR|nr:MULTISPECIES: formate hydrogenlyase regulator HycA [Cedecea]EPF13030.1 formate hydrogenlyase regulatory protein HycA [Cedecea davisae DSM 4568]MBU4682239.1 formate hydrogenlyase regulator HycA [Cedecea davisae]MBU4687272.1 formate hydrogenlyase regulator HycA [Cedecea davisae]QIX95813.1 formate hydrogenlyase regulator HycA [Cedecea sp. FDAARGOS_727]SUX37130.1 Formate hydrogenlyase regulatory protein hycA [Cedecea davisae]